MKVYYATGTNYLTQLFIGYNDGIEITRKMVDNTWGSWTCHRFRFAGFTYFTSITIGSAGVYALPDNKVPGTTEKYLFAIIEDCFSVSSKDAISIHGKDRSFIIRGTANAILSQVKINFYKSAI